MAKHRSIGFLGNSEELYWFLRKKRKGLLDAMTREEDLGIRKKMRAFIDMLEEMEELDYFHKGHIKNMPALIKVVSADYRHYKTSAEELRAEMEAAEKEAFASFQAAGNYLKSEYEEGYDSPNQIAAREAHDEYDVARWEYEQEERQAFLRHRLLGIIHEPLTFFKNVRNVKKEEE